MSRITCHLLIVGALPFLMFASGCGGGRPTIKTEYVEGVVTLDGTPVEGAAVMFVPVTKGQGLSATGYTDANGVYKLSANPSGEEGVAHAEAGTLPGEYYVSVSKAEVEQLMSQEEADELGVEYKPLRSGQSPKVTYIVPKKYKLAARSGLKVTVTEGENNIPLELTSN